MKLMWDEVKRVANLEKHGLDFMDVPNFDWAGAIIEPARASKFGGARLKAIGYYEDGSAVVIFASLGTEAISLVSFRPASAWERRRLDEKTNTPN